jgi:hypothetical protein
MDRLRPDWISKWRDRLGRSAGQGSRRSPSGGTVEIRMGEEASIVLATQTHRSESGSHQKPASLQRRVRYYAVGWSEDYAPGDICLFVAQPG